MAYSWAVLRRRAGADQKRQAGKVNQNNDNKSLPKDSNYCSNEAPVSISYNAKTTPTSTPTGLRLPTPSSRTRSGGGVKVLPSVSHTNVAVDGSMNMHTPKQKATSCSQPSPLRTSATKGRQSRSVPRRKVNPPNSNPKSYSNSLHTISHPERSKSSNSNSSSSLIQTERNNSASPLSKRKDCKNLRSEGLAIGSRSIREQAKKRRSNDGSGILQPSSVGSNVLVKWKGEELERFHYAPLHQSWSKVRVLRDAAARGEQENGYMVVNIEELRSDKDELLFLEDFVTVFGRIFCEYFVPLVHEQFNLKGEMPSRLPNDIGDSFKLLVLAERLDACLKTHIHGHMCSIISNDTYDKVPSKSDSFNLIKVSISFAKRAPKHSLQDHIIEDAITALVNCIPYSLAAMESLVREASEKMRPDMAVQLFQQATLQNMIKSQQIIDNTSEFIEDVKRKIKVRGKNHFDLFADHVARCRSAIMSQTAKTQAADAGTGFSQGMFLDKVDTNGNGSLRIVRCQNGVFEWTRSGKPMYAYSYKSTRRDQIISIGIVDTDTTKTSFRILYRSRNGTKTVIFRAKTEASCLSCVSALNQWLGRVIEAVGPSLQDVPVVVKVPPPPPLSTPLTSTPPPPPSDSKPQLPIKPIDRNQVSSSKKLTPVIVSAKKSTPVRHEAISSSVKAKTTPDAPLSSSSVRANATPVILQEKKTGEILHTKTPPSISRPKSAQSAQITGRYSQKDLNTRGSFSGSAGKDVVSIIPPPPTVPKYKRRMSRML